LASAVPSAETGTISSVAERILGVAGALFLVVGPARQAIADVRKAQSLAAAWEASDLTSVLTAWLAWVGRVGLGGASLVSPVLRFPLAPIRRAREALTLWREYKEALETFRAAAGVSAANAALVDDEVKKALNWGLVLIGSLLVFSATIVALVTYVA
jgi:hypothetical protein